MPALCGGEVVVNSLTVLSEDRVFSLKIIPDGIGNDWTDLGVVTEESWAKVTDEKTGRFTIGIYNNQPYVFTKDARVIKYNGASWEKVIQYENGEYCGSIHAAIDSDKGFAWIYNGYSDSTPRQYVKKLELN